jgi:hypothetical protein
MDCAPHAEHPVMPPTVGFEEPRGLLSGLGDEIIDTATDAKHEGWASVIFLGDLVARSFATEYARRRFRVNAEITGNAPANRR